MVPTLGYMRHEADRVAAGVRGPAWTSDSWAPRVHTLGELLTDPHVTDPPHWVLPPLVESGEVALLSAPPKTGKSHLVSQLAASLSVGGAALDGTPLVAAPVLWLALDEPIRRLVPRLDVLGADRRRFHVVQRDAGHVLTADHLAALLAECRPALVVLDTTSQLALDARVDPNDGVQVGAFLRPLVDAVRSAATADAPCAGLFIHHAPHHAQRAAGSLQWGAIVDADVVLRRPRRRFDPNAPEPDEDTAESTSGDDGARVLEGVTRAGGPFKLRLGFASGRYMLADAPLPLIDRVRSLMTTMQTGAGLSSSAKLRDHLNCNNAALFNVLRTLEDRGEVRAEGTRTSPNRHYVPTESMRLYVRGLLVDAGTSPEQAVHPTFPIRESVGVSLPEDVGRDAGATSSGAQGYPPAHRKKLTASASTSENAGSPFRFGPGAAT